MANSDVQVKEIKLLEAYSGTFKGFMESTITMTYRFQDLVQHKDDEAREVTRKIADHCNIIKQKLAHAKIAYEASLKSDKKDNSNEIMHRERALKKYRSLYEKAQEYEELSKKLYQKVHGETDRMDWMTKRFRNKLEKSRDDGNNYLKKAISTLNEYKDK